MNSEKELIKGKVSVVVASYNHVRYLKERMDSLVNQTWKNIEIIVIDDCSPDNSLEVLRPYTSYPQVQLIESQKNSGWVAVSNRGLELATGEFIIFANCDDFCDPQLIEKLVLALEKAPTASLSFCRSAMIDENSIAYGDDFTQREQSFKDKVATETFIQGKEMSQFLLHSCVMPNLSGIVFRTKDLKSVNGLSSVYRVCSDWDLFFKLAEKFDFVYVSEILNSFRQHRTTVRKTTKERVIYDEYFHLLSTNLNKLSLNLADQTRHTFRIATLWAQHMTSIEGNGMVNFFYHLKRNFSYRPSVVFILPFALASEILRKFIKLIKKIGSHVQA